MSISSVQSFSRVQLFVTPWSAACQASLSITNSQSLLKLISIESVKPYNHLILSSPSLPAFNLSQHQSLFQRVSVQTTSPSESVLPMTIQDCFLQSKALKSLLQHHSSKASPLQPSAFFMVQLSHPYMTNGKTIALTR